jgi:DNA-binding GntR family transcriptional regulator
MKNSKANEFLPSQIIDALFSENSIDDYCMTEDKLSKKFGISRSQIRESLKELEKIGVIERKQKKGINLKKPSSRLLAEVYDLRSVLEGFAGRLATYHCTNNDIEELTKIARAYSDGLSKGDHDCCERANIEFHNKIVMLSGNNVLIDIMNSYAIVKKAFKLAYSIEPEEIQSAPEFSHEKIVEKMRVKDADMCETLIRAHIQHSKKTLIEKSLGFKLNHFD